MAKQNINVGTAANDKKGDSLRAAFQKVNANFTELYTALGLNADGTLSLGAFEFAGSTMTTTDSTPIVIDQSVTVSSDLTIGGDLLPNIANGGNLGSLAKPFRSLYVSNSTVFLGGVPLSLDTNNNLTVNGSPVTGGGNSFDQDLNTDDSVTFNSVGATTVNVSQINGTNPGDELVIQANNHNWNFGTDGALTLPPTNIITAALSQQVGTIITDIEAWNWHNGSGNPYTWNQWNPEFLSLYNIGDSIIGWSFYSDADPSNVVTITARNPSISELTFSGDLGSPPYVAQSPDYSPFHGNPVVIQTQGPQFQANWSFGADGLLTLPDGQSIGSGSLDGIKMTTDRGTVLFGNSPECVPTLLTHFHIMKEDVSVVDLFFGDDNNYVKLPGDGETAYGVEIGTNVGDGANTWRFGTDGNLNLPNNNGQIGQLTAPYTGLEFRTGSGADWIGISYGEINDNNTSYFYFDKDGSDYLTANHRAHLQIKNPAHDGHVEWLFESDGDLTLPEGGDILNSNGDSVLGGGSYTPDDSGNWNDPTVNTVAAALDELAAKVAALENFEIDGGNAYTPAAGELIIDGNGA
jgi:hypothetical protein